MKWAWSSYVLYVVEVHFVLNMQIFVVSHTNSFQCNIFKADFSTSFPFMQLVLFPSTIILLKNSLLLSLTRSQKTHSHPRHVQKVQSP